MLIRRIESTNRRELHDWLASLSTPKTKQSHRLLNAYEMKMVNKPFRFPTTLNSPISKKEKLENKIKRPRWDLNLHNLTLADLAQRHLVQIDLPHKPNQTKHKSMMSNCDFIETLYHTSMRFKDSFIIVLSNINVNNERNSLSSTAAYQYQYQYRFRNR